MTCLIDAGNDAALIDGSHQLIRRVCGEFEFIA